jgi:hypothetical protein
MSLEKRSESETPWEIDPLTYKEARAFALRLVAEVCEDLENRLGQNLMSIDMTSYMRACRAIARLKGELNARADKLGAPPSDGKMISVLPERLR